MLAGPGLLRGTRQEDDLAYIKSIDGLRATAVLLVVLSHASVAHFHGGYVGVDAFFVISGFVITRAIMRSIEAGAFSYRDFILRRYARLTPALLVVLAFSAVAAVVLFTPRQLLYFSSSQLAALFSVSNIYFFFKSGYFDPAASQNPLLHTWSLGVEEQFYLVWPLLLLGFYRYGGHRFATIAIAVLSVASLGSVAWLAANHPSATFYLTPFRVYQLGLGSLIGLTGVSIGGRTAVAATGAGFLGLVATAMMLSDTSSVLVAGSASAAAAALFILGSRSAFAGAAFGNRPMSFVGKRAYSIYLVHWPLIVFAREYTAGISTWVSAPAFVLLSFVLGDLLYRFVENPFRIKDSPTRTVLARHRRVFGFSFAFQLSQALAATVLVSKSGFILWQMEDLARVVDQTRAERSDVGRVAEFGRCTLADGFNNFDPKWCLSASSDKPTVALLGDSFGIDTIVALRDLLGSTYHFAHASFAGCSPALPSTDYVQSQQCMDFNRQRIDLIEENGFKTVILASKWTIQAVKPTADLVRELVGRGVKVYVVGVRAVFDQDVTDILVKAGTVRKANLQLKQHLLPVMIELDAELGEMVRAAGGDYIRVLDQQCGASCNATTKDGALLYIDSSHFSRAGMHMLGTYIANHVQGRF